MRESLGKPMFRMDVSVGHSVHALRGGAKTDFYPVGSKAWSLQQRFIS